MRSLVLLGLAPMQRLFCLSCDRKQGLLIAWAESRALTAARARCPAAAGAAKRLLALSERRAAGRAAGTVQIEHWLWQPAGDAHLEYQLLASVGALSLPPACVRSTGAWPPHHQGLVWLPRAP